MGKITTEQDIFTSIVMEVNTSDTLPFTEKPSDEPSPEQKNILEASDLFSHFTANIIKEEVIFVR